MKPKIILLPRVRRLHTKMNGAIGSPHFGFQEVFNPSIPQILIGITI